MNRKRFVLATLFSLLLLCSPTLLLALEVGNKAPDFDLPSTNGDKLRLSSYAGKKNVVLQFYVLDFTPT